MQSEAGKPKITRATVEDYLETATDDDWPDRPPLTLLKPGMRIKVRYSNWRGEVAVRRLELNGVPLWGKTPWHPEPQWLITATDLDRQDGNRVFSIKDMVPVQ